MRCWHWKTGFLVALAAAALSSAATAAEPAPLNEQEIAQLHGMLKPQASESRWMEITWYPSVWEARQKAAAEGKPLFLWAGSGGAPPAGC